MRRELLLELGKRNRGEVAVVVRVDAGIVVLGLDVANLVDGDEHLAAALHHGDALYRGVRLGLRLNARLHLVQGLVEAVRLDRLHEVVDGVDLKGLECILAVGGHKDYRRRVLKLVEHLCELHAVGLGHRDVKEDDVRTRLHESLDRLACA